MEAPGRGAGPDPTSRAQVRFPRCRTSPETQVGPPTSVTRTSIVSTISGTPRPRRATLEELRELPGWADLDLHAPPVAIVASKFHAGRDGRGGGHRLMAQVHILGAGTPTPTAERFGSALVLELAHENLMFDCGPAATHKLVKAGFQPTDIGHLFFTHHHFDHDVPVLPPHALGPADRWREDARGTRSSAHDRADRGDPRRGPWHLRARLEGARCVGADLPQPRRRSLPAPKARGRRA